MLVLGVLPAIGGAGYLVDLFVRSLTPAFGMGISPFVAQRGRAPEAVLT
jgi:hypothetical protein